MICHCQQFRACPFKYLTANAHYQCSKQAGKQIVFRPVLKQKFSQACSKQLWYVNTPWKTLFSMLIFSQACSKQFWYVNTPWKTLFSVLILSIAAAVKWCYCWLFHASHTLTPLHPVGTPQAEWLYWFLSSWKDPVTLEFYDNDSSVFPRMTSETITTTVNKLINNITLLLCMLNISKRRVFQCVDIPELLAACLAEY